MTGAAAEARRRLGEGARERLRALPPPSRARGRAEAPLHRLLRRLRRAVRRAPRRLRARDEDRRGAGRLRRAEGGAGAADRRDRLGRGRRHGHVRPLADRRQHAYSLEIIKRFGFDESFARLDLTVHPFAASSGTQDIRLTTRYKEDDITSIFTAMHECGHGLYEHGVSSSLERTPLCHGVSSALHESQSRMWENIVGRSREFWNYFYPSFQERFPEAIGDVESEAFYPRDQPRQAVPRPRRRGRGDLQPAHHSPLRAGAGDLRGHDRPRRPAGRVEPPLRGVPRDRCRRTRSASYQDVHWSGRASATSPPTRSATSSRCRSGRRSSRSCPTCRSSSSRASSGSARVAADPPVRARPEVHPAGDARAGGRRTGDRRRAYVRYLKDKLGALAAA